MPRTGRPPKDKRLLMNIPLRIMLTSDQREIIEQAAVSEGLDMTGWARPILLEAAKRALARARHANGRAGHVDT